MARKKKEAKVDHCAVSPEFEGMIWEFLTSNPSGAASVGELVLWRKVIHQAMLDFCLIASSPSNLFLQNAAERWLLHSNKQFFVVCDLADLSAQTLRQILQQASETPEAFTALRRRLTRN